MGLHLNESPDNNAMHAKPDLRVEPVYRDHFFRLGDLCRYAAGGLYDMLG